MALTDKPVVAPDCCLQPGLSPDHFDFEIPFGGNGEKCNMAPLRRRQEMRGGGMKAGKEDEIRTKQTADFHLLTLTLVLPARPRQ